MDSIVKSIINSLGEPTTDNIYTLKVIDGQWWIEHKHVGSAEPVEQWLKSANKQNKEPTSFTDRLEQAETKEALLDIWLSYRKKKGKHANLYEQDVLLNKTWAGKSVDRIKEAISYTVSNGWVTLQYPEKQKYNGKKQSDTIVQNTINGIKGLEFEDAER